MIGVGTALWALVCIASLVDTVTLDSMVTKQLEEVIKKDEFILSLKHIKPRRRAREIMETLFSVDFPGTEQKFSLKLDRKTKRVIVEIFEDNKHRVQHFTVDALNEDSIIRSLILSINQKQPGAHATLYMNCISYGMVATPKALRDMFNTMDNQEIEVYHEKRYPMEVDGHKDIRMVLSKNECPLEPVEKKMFKNEDFSMSLMADDPRSRQYYPDRGDIPIISAIDDNTIIDALNKLIIAVNNLNNKVGEHTIIIDRLRQLIEECELCKQRPPTPTCATHNPCHRSVRCYDTHEGTRCGQCPAGMTGNGYECRPERSCRDRPCFSGVECQDTETGYRCGSCPHGYEGNGEQCRRRTGCEYNPCAPGCVPYWVQQPAQTTPRSGYRRPPHY